MTTNWKAEIKAIQELGCHDGSCLFRDNSKGQHTNGGCKCLARSYIHSMKELIRVIRSIPLEELEESTHDDNGKH